MHISLSTLLFRMEVLCSRTKDTQICSKGIRRQLQVFTQQVEIVQNKINSIFFYYPLLLQMTLRPMLTRKF